MRTFFSIISVSLILMACGVNFQDDPNALKGKGSNDPSPTPNASLASRTVTLKGYVSSAFDVTVDQISYNDTESFYTAKLDELTVQAAQDYPGYTVRLIGEIGLSDLARGMDVYVAADSKTGYATATHTDTAGNFEVSFPPMENTKYKVRAVKRLNVELIPTDKAATDKSVIQWCFNFSAQESDVTLDQPENPIILNTFNTVITKYKCEASAIGNSNLSIPAPAKVPAPAATTPAPVSLSTTPDETPAPHVYDGR